MLRVSQLQGQRQPPSRLQLTTPPSKPRLLRFCPASAALVAPSSVFAGPGVCNRRLPCTISGITCEDPYSSPQSIVHGGFGTLPHVWSGTLVGVSVATLQYNSVEIAKSSSYEHTERLRVIETTRCLLTYQVCVLVDLVVSHRHSSQPASGEVEMLRARAFRGSCETLVEASLEPSSGEIGVPGTKHLNTKQPRHEPSPVLILEDFFAVTMLYDRRSPV